MADACPGCGEPAYRRRGGSWACPTADCPQKPQNRPLSDAGPDPPRRAAKVESVQWGMGDALLIAWFEEWSTSPAAPVEPFSYVPWIRILNPTRFYASVHAAIARGPRDWKARHGVLQSELRQLQRWASAQGGD